MDIHLTAEQAFVRSKKKGKPGLAEDINYNLTIKRVMTLIGQTAEQGETYMAWVAPEFVLDGTLCDPVVLARQVKSRLTELGYRVLRQIDTLYIDWDQDLQNVERAADRKEKPDPKTRTAYVRMEKPKSYAELGTRTSKLPSTSVTVRRRKKSPQTVKNTKNTRNIKNIRNTKNTK